MKIYMIKWYTESGDSGMHGYWLTKPSEEQIKEYMRKKHPDDFDTYDDGYEDVWVYWVVEEFEQLSEIELDTRF